MTVFTFINNVNTTLAGAITSSSTTMTIASTANFPSSIPAGFPIAVTLNDQSTRGVFEIVYATAITGSTLTIQRGQEGTTPLSWLVGDFVFSGPTAGQMGSVNQGRLLNQVVFSAPGSSTYTPTPGTRFVSVEVLGGGGAGGSTSATTSTTCAAAAGGCSGGYARGLINTGFSGATVIVGAGGVKAAAGPNTGGTGGTSSFGGVIQATGGNGGLGAFPLVPPFVVPSNSGAGLGSGANQINARGYFAGAGDGRNLINTLSGYGAPSFFGGGAIAAGATNNGANATTVGSGGGGGLSLASAAAQQGGNGAPGIVIVSEFA